MKISVEILGKIAIIFILKQLIEQKCLCDKESKMYFPTLRPKYRKIEMWNYSLDVLQINSDQPLDTARSSSQFDHIYDQNKEERRYLR